MSHHTYSAADALRATVRATVSTSAVLAFYAFLHLPSILFGTP